MYMILRRVKIQPELVEVSIRRLEQGLVPLVRSEPGFVASYLVRAAEDEGLSITIFETKQQAEAGNRKSLEWARDQILPLAQGPAEVVGFGEVLIREGKAEQ